jgi:hypothetical protein
MNFFEGKVLTNHCFKYQYRCKLRLTSFVLFDRNRIKENGEFHDVMRVRMKIMHQVAE